MKCIFLTVVACFTIMAESHPFLGLDIASNIGQGIGSAVGAGVGLGMGTAAEIGAGALGLGVGVANGVANGIANGVGTGLGLASGAGNVFGLGGVAQRAASNGQRASNSGANQYQASASGVQSEGYHKKGEKSFHDRGHHHSSVTTITKAENSDEHDVGASAAIEEGAHAAGAYNKQASGAANYANNYQQGAREEAAALL